jgi:hypothetical protein
LQDLLKDTRQVVAGTAVSVTALRYQQALRCHDPPETLASLLITPEVTIIRGDICEQGSEVLEFLLFYLDVSTYDYGLRSRGILRLKPNEFVPSDGNRCP